MTARHPLFISGAGHFVLLAVLLLAIYWPQREVSRVNFKVYLAPKLATQKILLSPQAFVEPKREEPAARKVFGLQKKSLLAKDSDANAPVVKLGNTVASTPDSKILNDTDAESLPIPADEVLITQMPSIVSEFRIEYPLVAKSKDIEGPVVMDILIDDQGRVRDARLISSPHESLSVAALEAVRKFVFSPAKIETKSVAVRIRYSYRFVLEK